MYNKSEFTKELYRPAEVSKYLGVTSKTVSNYCDAGILKEVRSETNRRLITKESLLNYLETKNMLFEDNARYDVIYSRVSTHKQKERGDLDRQTKEISTYAIRENPRNLLILEEVGSGLNDNRPKLKFLITKILDKEVDRIFINYKDRLTRFGYHYLEQICKHNGTEIIVVSNELLDKSLQEELAEDICSIIHSFSGELYGMRRKIQAELDDIGGE